jgi:hypothetical protein
MYFDCPESNLNRLYVHLHDGPTLPALHRHEPMEGLPGAWVSRPSGQAMHSAEPVAALYVPASHAEQGPPSGPLYPALHWQAVFSVLPLSEVLFAAHGVQSPAPVAAYFPATHATQDDSLAWPAIDEYLPAVQDVQVATLCAPITAEYFPAEQGVHSPAPVAEYFPAAHVIQDDSLVWRTPAEYLPAAQGVQKSLSAPVHEEKVPAAQFTQGMLVVLLVPVTRQ